jgi:hypothetical protein
LIGPLRRRRTHAPDPHRAQHSRHPSPGDLLRESRNEGRPIALSGIHTAYVVPTTVAWMQRAARCETLARNS